ncbi:polysaccharide lyase 6 family protein [Promicromonospora sp. NPDC019610]|uniref:polysaccharide lyase 6 family protein n=1 Tax=Promicromonospora sp. NPDC019610 TaxID=3364405 RepID=UPI00379A7286
MNLHSVRSRSWARRAAVTTALGLALASAAVAAPAGAGPVTAGPFTAGPVTAGPASAAVAPGLETAARAAADPAPLRTVRVSTSAELAAAFAGAVAGNRIVLADGEYSMVKLADKAGTEEHPVVIEGATLGGAVVTGGQLEVTRSHHVVVRGLAWRNAATLKIEASTNVRLTRNDFRLAFVPPADPASARHWVSIAGEGSGHHRVDHNAFAGKTVLGNYVTVYGGATQISQHDRIDHNYFADSPAQPVNGGEAIRLGVSALSDSSSFAVVEHNLFENCDSDPEIVSLKSDDNTVRYNTFRTSAGSVVARRGDRNAIHGNVFLGGGKAGTGGVRLYGDDQRVHDNYFEGLAGSGYTAALQVDGGDVDGSGSTSGHWRVHRATIVHNTFVDNVSNVELGANYVYPPADVTLANNVVVGSTGRLFAEHKATDGLTLAGNIAYPQGSATLGIAAQPGQIRVADPLLVRSGGLWRLRQGPAVDAAVGTYSFVVDDLDGQPRDQRPDVGADEVSTAPVLRHPLTASDVGPLADL